MHLGRLIEVSSSRGIRLELLQSVHALLGGALVAAAVRARDRKRKRDRKTAREIEREREIER